MSIQVSKEALAPVPVSQEQGSTAAVPVAPNSPAGESYTVPVSAFMEDTFSRAKGMDDHTAGLSQGPGGKGSGSEPVFNDDSDLVNPVPEATPAFGPLDPGSGIGGAPEGMSETDAMKETRTLMGMRQSAQAVIISMIADGKADGYKTYFYDPWQFDLLCEAYMPLVQGAGIKVNPWIKVGYAELMGTGPLVQLTIKNRNMRIENERMKAELERRDRKQNSEAAEVAPDTAGATRNRMPPPPGVQTRYDIKTHWKVDDNGYFEFNVDKVRIPIPHRRIKPQLTEENYALLCKHNTQERIDRIYGIKPAG